VKDGIWRYIKMYILGSVHIAVVFVIKHSSKQDIWRYINVYILGSVHTAVMCAIKDSLAQVI
jgi:hypothetical protein